MRPTWDEYFIDIAKVVRRRSTCSRGKVGAVICRDRRILATGYNGTPSGMPHCTELGCDVDSNSHEAGCHRTVHAEANAIAWAARSGVAVDGSTMYCTHSPCYDCAKLLIAAGISTFIYDKEYRDPAGKELLVTAQRSVLRCSDESAEVGGTTGEPT